MTTPRPIMIVDDDVPLRNAFARAVERAGYDVIATTGSPEVVALVEEHRPVLMLIDNHMPGASGLELIKAIRRNRSSADLPIILVTGSSMQGEIDEAMNSGATDFRRKPVDLHDLLAVVESTLASHPPATDEILGSSS